MCNYYVIKHDYGRDYIPVHLFKTREEFKKNAEIVYKGLTWVLEGMQEIEDES